MPNPVPLATKEEEERRAWVTAHHEVVTLIKECFGDRFSNNEIFDRLKISRRTGYRALSNDERIGKAPGRKPKIMESTLNQIIEYLTNDGAKGVGNVWKHLAEKFAPDCNPKTVQDAVKKHGFNNYNSELLCPGLAEISYTDNPLDPLESFDLNDFLNLNDSSDSDCSIQGQVKLEPLLNLPLPDNQPAPAEEAAAAAAHLEQNELDQHAQQERQVQQAQQAQQVNDAQQVIDPTFHQHTHTGEDELGHAIRTASDAQVRFILHEVTARVPAAYSLAHSYLPSVVQPYTSRQSSAAQVAHMGDSNQMPSTPGGFHGQVANSSLSSAKRRIAVCRRCNRQFDRAMNTMDKRECVYHKGSTQKINPQDTGTIQESPQAFIWSCCGGNGLVPGCAHAMHTTKKKRKYVSKKRSATDAGFDEDDDQNGDDNDGDSPGADESTMLESPHLDAGAHESHHTPATPGRFDNPNIDSSLQDYPGAIGPQVSLPMAAQMPHTPGTAPTAAMQQHGQNIDPHAGPGGHFGVDANGQHHMPPVASSAEFQALQMAAHGGQSA